MKIRLYDFPTKKSYKEKTMVIMLVEFLLKYFLKLLIFDLIQGLIWHVSVRVFLKYMQREQHETEILERLQPVLVNKKQYVTKTPLLGT